MKSPPTKPIRLHQERYQENLEVMLKNLLKDETLSDITIHCRDGAVRAHRIILAASSPFFRKVFQEHPEHQVVFLLHGVTVKQIRSLIELMYRGSTQIPSDMMNKLCDIAEDFGIRDIIDENEKSLLNTAGRDTRFKGQKRVLVDFENDSSDTQAKTGCPKFTKTCGERRLSGSSDKSSKKSADEPVNNPWASTARPSTLTLDSLGLVPTTIKQEPRSPSAPSIGVLLPSITPLTVEARRRSNWAMKQRKYKCSLCPASFKRASHLSRHQLVHTGERPYACDQCDKAFSRHDKLKHHIRKTHIPEYVGNIMENSTESEVYTIGHVEMDTPHSEISEEPSRITREDLVARMTMKVEPEPEVVPDELKMPPVQMTPDTLTPNPSETKPSSDNAATESSTNVTIAPPPVHKKGRGRPRKYPPVPKPLIKRPRGRPRLNQSVQPIRPGPNPSEPDERRSDNYDITNMPFGDLEYLTKSLHMEQPSSESFEEEANPSMEQNVMEPLVEIELDQNSSKEPKKDSQEEDPVQHHNSASSFLQNIGLLETSSLAKMEIGECTISVSSGSAYAQSQ